MAVVGGDGEVTNPFVALAFGVYWNRPQVPVTTPVSGSGLCIAEPGSGGIACGAG